MSEDSSVRNSCLKLIYKEYFSRIEAFVIKNSGDHSDAKDVFQEAIMILYQNVKKGKFRAESSLFTYIYSICRNLWFQRLKQQPMIAIDSVIENELTSEDILEDQVNIGALKKIMNGLKEDCKKILIGFYYESKSMEQLSRMFGLGSAQAAKNKKSRCLKHLSKMVSENGLTYENFIL